MKKQRFAESGKKKKKRSWAEIWDRFFAEVDWVLSEADFMGDGAIHTTELVMATQSWYSYAASNPSAGPILVQDRDGDLQFADRQPKASACCSIS